MRELDQVIELGWSPYLGKTDSLVKVTLLGRYPVKVQDFWVPAVEAMERALIDTGYENPCDWIGSYAKRPIAGTDVWSFHSYGGAIDLDYGGDNPDSPDHPLIDKNPHIHRRITEGDPGFGVEWQILEHQVRAIEAIRTVNGAPVWRWLGWAIGDSMHFEPACSPADIATGIASGGPYCVPDWYDSEEYWEPYVNTIWKGGAPDPCQPITHWQMSVILRKLGLTE